MTKEQLTLEQIRMNVEYILSKIEEMPMGGGEKPIPEWLTLEECVPLKGGAALNTVKSKPWLQPCAGKNSKKVGGRKCWQKEDVFEWLKIDDEKLDEYCARWGIKPKKA